MLKRLLLLRVPVRPIIIKDDLTLLESEWDLITQLIDVLAPIKALSEILCGSRYPTMGLVYPMLKGVLDNTLKSHSNNPTIRKCKDMIRSKLEEDIKNSGMEGLMQVCAYLDPR